MRKYGMICRMSLMEQLQYVPDMVMGFGSFFILLFINIRLWDYMYADPGMLIAGYEKRQMIWYVMITETIWFGGLSNTVTRQAATDIRGGNIAYLVSKPYHYALYILSRYAGEWSIRLPMYALVATAAGLWLVGPLPGFTVAAFPAMALSMVLGLTIHAVFRLCISLISFWIEDSAPFQWLYGKVILMLGTLFPVEIFPAALQPFIKMTPIYTVCYGPARLIIDFGPEKFVEILSAQLLYLAAGLCLMFCIYGRGVRKLHVNGG